MIAKSVDCISCFLVMNAVCLSLQIKHRRVLMLFLAFSSIVCLWATQKSLTYVASCIQSCVFKKPCSPIFLSPAKCSQSLTYNACRRLVCLAARLRCAHATVRSLGVGYAMLHILGHDCAIFGRMSGINARA
jgi:hypothetical protein